MTREQLKELNMTDEQIDRVMALNGRQINELKAQRDSEKQRAEAAQGELNRMQSEAARARKAEKIRAALGTYKPRDAELVMRILDEERIELDEADRLSGLEEQVQRLREHSGYLFEQTPSAQGGLCVPQMQVDNPQDFDMNDFLRR